MKLLTNKQQTAISGGKNRCECHPFGTIPRISYYLASGMFDHDSPEACRIGCCSRRKPPLEWQWIKNFTNSVNIKHGMVQTGACNIRRFANNFATIISSMYDEKMYQIVRNFLQ